MISLAAALPIPTAVPRGPAPVASGPGTATFVLPVADGEATTIASGARPAERQGDAVAGGDLPVAVDMSIALPDVTFDPVEPLAVDRRFMASVPVADPRSGAADVAAVAAAVLPAGSAILPEASETPGTAVPVVRPVVVERAAIAPAAGPAERQGDAFAGGDLPVAVDMSIALPDVTFDPVEPLAVDRRFMASVPVADPRSGAADVAAVAAAVLPAGSAILPEASETPGTAAPVVRPVVVERAAVPTVPRASVRATKRDAAPSPNDGNREEEASAAIMPMVAAAGEPIPIVIAAEPVTTIDRTPSLPVAPVERQPAPSEGIGQAAVMSAPDGGTAAPEAGAVRTSLPAVRQMCSGQGEITVPVGAPVSASIATAKRTEAVAPAPVARGSRSVAAVAAMDAPTIASATLQVDGAGGDRSAVRMMADDGMDVATSVRNTAGPSPSPLPAPFAGAGTETLIEAGAKAGTEAGVTMAVVGDGPVGVATIAPAGTMTIAATIAFPAAGGSATMRPAAAAIVEQATPWRFAAAAGAVVDAGGAAGPVVAATGTPPVDRIAAVPVSSVIEDAVTTEAPATMAAGPLPGRTVAAASVAPVAAAVSAASTAAPAGVVFAPAIAASDDRDRRPVRSVLDRAMEPGVATGAPVLAPRVEAAVQAPLDLSQPRWPQGMVDRIAALRDAADAADTRIRLVPDALGAIDIAVRREGDTVHVHFTAEQAQTRTLLQEAQPRLAEAAADRGLKLGQTSVDLGTAGQNGAGGAAGSETQGGAAFQSSPQGQGRQPQPAMPVRPTGAVTSTTAEMAYDDARIA